MAWFSSVYVVHPLHFLLDKLLMPPIAIGGIRNNPWTFLVNTVSEMQARSALSIWGDSATNERKKQTMDYFSNRLRFDMIQLDILLKYSKADVH